MTGSAVQPRRVLVYRLGSLGDTLVVLPAFHLIREVFPEAVVAPSLVLGATDGRWYAAVADDVYRLLPFRLGPADITRIHGKDERLGTANLANGVRFYRRFIAKAASAE